MAESIDRPIRAAALVVLLAAAAIGCARSRASDDAGNGAKPVKARVVPAVSRDVQRTVDSVGSLFPFEEVTVSSEVEGRVDQVYVDVGDGVLPGRPLVKIVPVELSLTLDEQRAALRQIEARLAPPEGGQLAEARQLFDLALGLSPICGREEPNCASVEERVPEDGA